jgi:hypothetical protein
MRHAFVPRVGLAVVLPALWIAGAALALEPKDPTSVLDLQEFAAPELTLSSAHVPLAEVLGELPNRSAWDAFLAERGDAPGSVQVYVDPRSGAASNLLASFPLLPGDGLGNQVTLTELAARLGRPVAALDAAVVADVARRFVLDHAALLGIDPAELGPVSAVQLDDRLWQVSAHQRVGDLEVRWARLAATIVHGNLVTLGTEAWGRVALDPSPALGAEKALSIGFEHVGGLSDADLLLRAPALEIVPVAPGEHQAGEAFVGPVGAGYGHRLVWSFVFQREPDLAHWEVLVDAHSGEVLALQDINQYVQRGVSGGVYPTTSTGICPNPGQCGTMQSGWPMPYANTGLAAPNNFANGAGVFDWTSGTVTTTLSGRYFRMVDSCGSISASSATGDINLGGTNGQHDCTTPGSGGAGNTPASRSGFYELNRIAEQARGWLPSNTWLGAQVTSNMNLNQTCNAFWSPAAGTVNFYRSGGGCRNTGELAGVFDHEWGHGMDDNDAGGSLSNSSEAYADVAAIYRLQTSCVGHGFFWTLDDGCGQTADGTGFNANEALTGASYCCTDCSGVRDADYAKHVPATPATALGFVCGQCTSGTGPCGRQVHCAAAPSRQAAWDLVARDLTAAPFGLDSQSAFLVGSKLFYHGSGNIGSWHACTCGSSSSGCGATNAYMQWLAADDDNGNVNDGTPHMTALHAAFNRHGIACATPTPVNSGCSGGPATAPTLTVTAGNFQNQLSWGPVAGASRYWVMRTEGHAGCDLGKTRIADVTGTSYTDTAVVNGRTYYYNVVAQGASSACYSRVSACVPATPSSSPDFSLACSPSSLTIQQGQSGASTCTVTSTGGFSSAVDLACSSLPAGVSCGYVPDPVTPPANGSASSTLTVSVGGATTPGSYGIQATGTSGATTRSAALALTVTTAPVPDFSVACSPSSLSIQQGSSGGSTCTVTSTGGFSAAVGLSCSGLPGGATCSFSPASVTPPANGSASSALTVSVSPSTPTGTTGFSVVGTSGATTRSASMSLTVTGAGGGGDLTAVFDAALQAPRCSTVGRSCDTGPALVLGRDGDGPEPNQPNTIADSCADGTSGTFHVDESNDRLAVSTVDGTDFAPGKTVRIDATVWAWSTPSADRLDLFYAANAASPSWTQIATLTPTAAGAQTLSATYTLPAGALQAVRAQFRYQSTAAACSAGGYNDRDDLVFAVTSTPVTTVFSDTFETALGWTTNPNGTDTATTGAWERGDPEQTTSSGTKQLGTTVSGVNDLVTGRLAGSSAGAFDIDGGVTTIQSPPIALPATGTLTLGFSHYLAHGSNSSSADFLRVYVVGSTTSLVFEELGAANDDDAAWATASANLSSFAGQTVRIRIEAADASTASLVEAAVDDVVITQQ